MRPLLLAALLSLVGAPAFAAEPAKPAAEAAPVKGRILGIGGVFFKSDRQKELYAWYRQHLGLAAKPNEGVMFQWDLPGAKPRHLSTSWGIFPATSTYLGPGKAPFMVNYIVDDLDALLARLKAEGVTIDPKREADEFGKFGWIYDADGNKIELWQPAD